MELFIDWCDFEMDIVHFVETFVKNYGIENEISGYSFGERGITVQLKRKELSE